MQATSTYLAPLPLAARWLGRTAYAEALAVQESCVAAKIAGEPGDEIILVEHEPTFTLGRGADERDLHGAPALLGVPVFRVGRGGGATFHGPGQLVAYPIIRLTHRGRDVHRYVRMLERTLIATCARFGITATAPAGATGVWANGSKIASIGIGVRRGVTYHGIALNVTTDLSYFAAIVTCRQADLRMTSMACLLERAPALTTVGDAFVACFAETFGYGVVRRGAA